MEPQWKRLEEEADEPEANMDLEKGEKGKANEQQEIPRKSSLSSSSSSLSLHFSDSEEEIKMQGERRKKERAEVSSSSINQGPHESDAHGEDLPNEETSLSNSSRNANSRRVRRNIQANLFQMTGLSKCIFVTDLVFHITQIAALVTILVLSRKEECDSHLRVFLYGHLFRSVFLLPLMVHRKLYSPEDTRSCANKLYSFINFLGTLWFLFGNWWLFSSSTCGQSSPLVYYSSLTLIMIGYFFLAFPFFLCLGITFCLPCILFAAGRVAENDTSKGASSAIIEALPEEVYDESKINKEDASCVICLNEYEKGEKLKRLPCKHHFHASCIEQWLKINKHCPLCMQPIEPEAAEDEP